MIDQNPNVFPAHAGMFLMSNFSASKRLSFPRARGDVPAFNGIEGRLAVVFPAHAGMFRGFVTWDYSLNRFPRARGDVPQAHTFCNTFARFSPRTRGCSAVMIGFSLEVAVFPAHAGMFRQ